MITDEPVRGGFPDSAFFALPGAEQLRMLLRGQVVVPPLSHLVGHRGTQIGSGHFTMALPASPWLQHGEGTIDLRISAGEALECAVLSGSPANGEVRLADLSMSYLRPCRLENAPLIGRARVLHTGPNLSLAEVMFEDNLGRNVAHATGHVRVHPMDPPAASGPWEPTGTAEPSYPTLDPYLRNLTPGVGTLPPDIFQDEDGMTAIRLYEQGNLPRVPCWELIGARLVDATGGTFQMSLRTREWLCAGPER